MEIIRVERPSIEEFRAAAEVCELRWPYLRPLHTDARFRGFQRQKIELIIARGGEKLNGVCFALPCCYEFSGGRVEWVNLFQLATRPEARNVGALMMMRIMHLYPTVVSLGVTEDATRMYVAMRWKRYDGVWRGVHPIDMKRAADDYVDRVRPWQRQAFRSLAGVYNTAAGLAESGIAAGQGDCGRWDPATATIPALREKGMAIGSYFPLLHSGQTRAVDAGGSGRILNSYQEGWGTLRDHARLWRDLRRRGAKLCELLATTPAAKARMVRLGYAPVEMPLWYQDKNGMGARLVEAFTRNEVSFFHTDKSV